MEFFSKSVICKQIESDLKKNKMKWQIWGCLVVFIKNIAVSPDLPSVITFALFSSLFLHFYKCCVVTEILHSC